MRGVEPLSWSTPKQISTCLVEAYLLFVDFKLLPNLALISTIPSCWSHSKPKVFASSQNALWHPDCLSILQAADVAVKLRSQCVLFVRNYCFNRCFTRPTIILDMQSTPNAANRIRYTPELRLFCFPNLFTVLSVLFLKTKRTPSLKKIDIMHQLLPKTKYWLLFQGSTSCRIY